MDGHGGTDLSFDGQIVAPDPMDKVGREYFAARCTRPSQLPLTLAKRVVPTNFGVRARPVFAFACAARRSVARPQSVT